MWLLRARNEIGVTFLFHTMDDLAKFVLNQPSFFNYELEFVTIWQPLPVREKSPSDTAAEPKAGMANFPIPMSHTE